MSASPPDIQPVRAEIVASSARCGVAACALMAVIAIVVVLTGMADEARRALRFGFGGVERSLSGAAQIAIHNARFAAGTLICAALVPRVTRHARILMDGVLAAVLVLNAGAVGVAIGAYGSRAIEATGLHLALEFAALSFAGGAYIQSRRQPLRAGTLALVAATCAAVLALAAALETYVPIGAPR